MGLSKTSKNKAFFDDPLRRAQRYAEKNPRVLAAVFVDEVRDEKDVMGSGKD
jgi:hypothetical protein